MLVRLVVISVFLALVVFVAGCGGGSSSSTVEASSGHQAEGPETAKADFIAEADARCSDYQAEVKAIRAKLEVLAKVADPESRQHQKQVGELLGETGDDGERELESIGELEVPQGDEATIEKLLDTEEEGNVLVGEGAAAIEEGDVQRFNELAADGKAVDSRAARMAENYGFKVCG